jgi:Protein of unknown function (DUF2442)
LIYHTGETAFLITMKKILKQITQAKLNAQLAYIVEPHAVSAIYNAEQNLIVITLKNGVIFSILPHLIQGLENANKTELNNFWFSESESSIHWDILDADFSISGLIAWVFGTEKWLNQLNAKLS